MGYYQYVPFRELGDYTRVIIDVWELDTQEVNLAKADYIKRKKFIDSYSFLVGESLFEQFTHSWSEFQNMAGRLTQRLQTYERTLKSGKSIFADLFDRIPKTGNIGDNLIGDIKDAIGTSDRGTGSGGLKADSPLIYDRSERRKLNLTINLAGQASDPNSQSSPQQIMACADDFRRFGCARRGTINKDATLNRIKFPYIFEIKTEPRAEIPLIKIKYAIMNTMQVTYKYPFMDGYPTGIDMILEFEDLEPLYAESFKEEAGGNVTVTGPGPGGGL